ncbi:MAG: hypothetical protein HYY61_05515 [Deltaproteobacteria bacterium]|nr:hypothetical protein [Deltaproteobacteria bacterium]
MKLANKSAEVVKNILKLSLFLIAFSLPVHAQNVQKEVASQVVKKLIQNTRQEGGEILWANQVRSAFSEVLTLEAQQAVREYNKRLYGDILKDLQRSWLRRWNGAATEKVVMRAEQRAATKLQAFYDELGQAFQSKNDLISYIEKNAWVEKGLLSEEEILTLRNLRASSEKAAIHPFETFQALRQSQLEAELRTLLSHAGQPIAADLDRIALIMKNISERNQYLWSTAEARFAMKLQSRWYYLWVNHWSKDPTLRSNWFRLFRRWQAIVKVPKHTPQGAAELANFFIRFTHLLSESLAYRSPRALSFPWRYMDKAIEHHAKVLSSDLELMITLNNTLPEVKELITAKMRQEALLLQLEEKFDTSGFEGLLKAIQGNAPSLEAGVVQTLQKIEGGYNPLSLAMHHTQKWDLPYPGFSSRGHHIRQWLFRNSITAFILLQFYDLGHVIFADVPEEDQPPFIPQPYPGDIPHNDWPEWQGQPPQTRPAEEIGDVYQQILIQQKEQEIQRLQEIQMNLAEKLLVVTDEERPLLEEEIRQNDAQIIELQSEIEAIYKDFGPSESPDSK